MKCFLVVLLCVVACALAAQDFNDCGSKLATVKSVKIGDKDQCEIQAQAMTPIQIDFEMKEKVEKDVKITSRAFNFAPITLEGGNDACKTGGLTCPFEKGQSYTYKNKGKLQSARDENTEVKLLFVTKDKDGKNIDMFCVKVPCKGLAEKKDP